MQDSSHKCTNCMHCIVIFLNVLAVIASFVMINCGAILMWNAPLVQSLAGRYLSGLASGPVSLTEKQVQEISADFHTLIAPVGWAPFIFGFFVFAAAILAFVGICCRKPDVLLAYAILTGLLIVIPVLIIIIYVSNRATMMVSAYSYLESRMMAYESIESGTTPSLLMGTMMAGYSCCGVENGSDFLKQGWKFTMKDNIQGFNIPNLGYPIACCKSKQETTESTTTTSSTTSTAISTTTSTTITTSTSTSPSSSTTATTKTTTTTVSPLMPTTPNPYGCPFLFTLENSNIATGCKKVITEKLAALTDIVAFTSVVPIVFNVLLLAITIVLLINYRRSYLM